MKVVDLMREHDEQKWLELLLLNKHNTSICPSSQHFRSKCAAPTHVFRN
jgi:hypothetical protein